MTKENKINWFKVFGFSVLTHIILIELSILTVFIYSIAIAPNQMKKGLTIFRNSFLLFAIACILANLSLHLVFDMKAHAAALKKLGKHKTGTGCLYINKLEDVDLKV